MTVARNSCSGTCMGACVIIGDITEPERWVERVHTLMAQTIKGRCHCGNIANEFKHHHGDDIAVRACGCDFCGMHGGVRTSDAAGSLRINIEDIGLLNKYNFGTKTADFYICSRCGVVPTVVSEIENQTYAVVNVNTFQDVDISRFEKAETNFGGEGTNERLARRCRNWIPDVRVSIGIP